MRTARATERRINGALRARHGLDLDVVVRTADEWHDIIAANPFVAESRRDPGHLVLMVFATAVANGAVSRLKKATTGGERLIIEGSHGYIVYPDGIGFDVPVYSVPTAGGEARRLPTAWQAATLIGVTRDGSVLVQRRKNAGNGEPGSEQFEMGRLRPGAQVIEPFWVEGPPAAYALKAWDDGAGGIYLNTWEWDPNGAFHSTMWSLDAEGRGRRLACDPVAGSMIPVAAIGPDGIYGILRPGNTPSYWSVVKISR
jgi:hypothetical protein